MSNEARVNGDVFGGQVAGTINNIDAIQIASPSSPEPDPILKKQRAVLNGLVEDVIAAEGGSNSSKADKAKRVWNDVHVEVSVEHVGDMNTEQFHRARSYLSDRLERAHRGSIRRRQMAHLLKNHKEAAEAFALGAYGLSRLKDLTDEQLESLISAVSLQPKSCGHDCQACRQSSVAELATERKRVETLERQLKTAQTNVTMAVIATQRYERRIGLVCSVVGLGAGAILAHLLW